MNKFPESACLQHLQRPHQAQRARRLPLGAALLAAVFATATPAAQAQAPALPQATLDTAIATARQAASAGAPQGARIEVSAGALDRRLRLAPCARIDTSMSPGARTWGHTRVSLRCVGGTTAWKVSLPVTVQVFAPALVSNTALAAGSVLDASQLHLAEVDWAAATSPVQTNAQALAGRTLARALQPGQPVRASDVKARQWFAAGDTVRITASGAGFSVSGEGRALSNGIEGQSARVRTASGRLVSGEPVGEHHVEVAL